MKKITIKATMGMALLLLTACSSLVPTSKEISNNDIPKNETLKEVDFDSLEKGVQWVSDTVQPHYYTSLIVPKVKLERNITYSKQIPEAVLEELSTIVTKQLRSNISSDIKVVDKVGPHVAQINLRISRATANPEDLKLTEVIPIGAVIGAVKMALGTRDQSVRIIIEAQIVDSISNKPLAERVSVIEAAGVLENDKSSLRYEQIKKDVDNFVKDVRTFIQSAAYEAQQRPVKAS